MIFIAFYRIPQISERRVDRRQATGEVILCADQGLVDEPADQFGRRGTLRMFPGQRLDQRHEQVRLAAEVVRAPKPSGTCASLATRSMHGVQTGLTHSEQWRLIYQSVTSA